MRGSWKGLLQAAGLWTSENENLIVQNRQLCRHDIRRSWSAHAKDSGIFTVEEASKVLGHNPNVNMNHYSGDMEMVRMQEKMQRHPSNHLKLVTDSWYAGGTEGPKNESDSDPASQGKIESRSQIGD